jgi:FkbM family methyltransferase
MLLAVLDVPLWAKPSGVDWKVKVRLVRHASFFILAKGVEPGIVAWFRVIAKEVGLRSFWDVGANVGYYSWLVKSISPLTEVRMFEPDPDNLSLVRETIEHRRLTGVTLREVAVSDMVGPRCFALDTVSGLTGGILEDSIGYSEREWRVPIRPLTVNAVSLDNERNETGPIDLIKIDVEGHEEAVIRGGRETIRSDQPVLIFECFHGGAEIRRTLEPLGYALLDAERTSDVLNEAINFVAFPSRHKPLLEELRCRWKDEMAGAQVTD